MDKKNIETEIKNCKIREGCLYKRSKFLKEWRERWTVLTLNYLFTFTNKTCDEVTEIVNLRDIKSYKSYLRNDEEMIPAGFKVRSEDEEMYFCARSPHEKWSWIVTLERLMDYKYVGPSNYNTIDYIKTRGFESQLEWENGGAADKNTSLEKLNAEKKTEKKNVDEQAEKIMKQLEEQQNQLKKKEQQIQQKEESLKARLEEQQAKKEVPPPVKEEPKVKEAPKQASKEEPKEEGASKVSELRKKYEQMQNKQEDKGPVIKQPVSKQVQSKKSEIPDLSQTRSKVVSNLFEEFHPKADGPVLLKNIVDFLMKSSSTQGFETSIVIQAKSHKFRQNFSEIFIQLLTDYKDYPNSHLVSKFIQTCVFHVPGLFKKKDNLVLQKKIAQFVLNVNEQSKLQYILRTMFVIHKIQAYPKNPQVKKKLESLIKSTKSDDIKNWSHKLVNDL